MNAKTLVIWELCVLILVLHNTDSNARIMRRAPPYLTNRACANTVADIIFVLDDSGSVTLTNFQIVKRFIIGIVNSMNIGYNRVRVAAISFSTSPRINFYLNSYKTKRQVIQAIINIPYRTGSTNTHYALRTLRKMFKRRYGDRRNAPNIAIIITDGISSRPRFVNYEANLLKKLGVTMFSIGIGSKLRQSDLRAMASQPTWLHKFTVRNFYSLNLIKNKITTRTCKGIMRRAPPYLTNRACANTVADIIFVLDDSGSVTLTNFQIVKRFIIGIVNSMNIGYNRVRVAAISFSTSPRINFYLNSYKTKRQVIQAIINIPYRTGSTNTHYALRTLRKMFKRRYGDRRNAPNIAIIITDGISSRPRFVNYEANILKKLGVTMFSIGIGSKLRQSDLRAMASQPTWLHKFTVRNFNSLNLIKNKITTRTCKAPKYITNRAPKYITNRACANTVADIIFVLDDSGSVTLTNFQIVKRFIIGIVNSMNIGYNRVRVAAISFSTSPRINFYLNSYKTKRQVIQAIINIPYRTGSTNTHYALRTLRKMFKRRYGDRRNAPNIAIIITDGISSRPRFVNYEANILKKLGVTMFSIGIGSKLRQSDLRAMASQPTWLHKFTVRNFNSLNLIKNKITTRTCKVNPCAMNPCKNNGICIPRGRLAICKCLPGYMGKKCERSQPVCICSASGDPHYRTFDGQMIHFMGICKYLMAASLKGVKPFFNVEVKNEHRGNIRVSYTRMVDITLASAKIRLLPRNKILINGLHRSVPIKASEFLVTFSGGWITVSTKWGLRVQFDGYHRIYVKLPGTFRKKLTGICGNCNGRRDDFRTRQGKNVSNYRNKFSMIGNSYKVHDDSDKPETKCAVKDVKNNCKTIVTKRCNIIWHSVFRTCIQRLGKHRAKSYTASCKMDTCMYSKNKRMFNTVFCRAIEGFARECEKVGIVVNWRKYSNCVPKCGRSQHYQFNALVCQPTCTNRKPKCYARQEACVCNKGFVLSGTKCVPISKCGCKAYGIYLVRYEVIYNNKCNMRLVCSKYGSLTQQKLRGCTSNQYCGIKNGKRSCMCKKGYRNIGGRCIFNPCDKNPCKNKGICIPRGRLAICKCIPGFMGRKCERFDPCGKNPCKNNGKCIRRGKTAFCQCPRIFMGTACEKVNPCGMRPCKNNGKCVNRGITITCKCPRGFSGWNCAKVHPCLKNPCKNKGNCYTIGKIQKCKCRLGFKGKKCEKADPCALKPCKNGAKCKTTQTSFKCICKGKTYGRFCEKVNPCDMKPCKNNGKCYRLGRGAFCKCPPGFSGWNCAVRPKNPCAKNPCKNGGTCKIHGINYKCVCKKGFIGNVCEKRIPDCVCSGSGDPHYKTFDGQWIHFMGVCKYTLAMPKKTSRLPHFSVEVKNEHRGNTRVSYTRLVDLKLNGATIRLHPGSKLSVNSELMALPLKNYLGFSAVYSAGWIRVTTKFGLKVQFDGRHRVIVIVPSIYRNHLTGICGDCNGRQDDYKTKAGVNVSRKPNKYSLIGRSYEVTDDSGKPQKNCKVVDFVPKCKRNNVCGLLSNKNGPFAECLKKLGKSAKDYLKACNIDACAYKKTPKVLKTVVCQAYEALSKRCEELNILIQWRPAAKCPLKCPQNMVYAYKTSVCQPSCSNRKPVCYDGFMEGCVCKSGTILSGDKCVPVSSCGCTYNGMYLKARSSFLLNDCSKRIVCEHGGKIRIKPGCGANTMCVVKGGERACSCKTNFQMINNVCRKVIPLPPPIIDPKFLGPVMHMFVRVSVAFMKGKPIKKFSGKIPKDCATKCLHNKKCKSFNFDELKEKCELFSFNAEKITLVSGDCPYKDYYQLIDSKKIEIRGATIFTCVHLTEYARVKTLAACNIKCEKEKCNAMEYSVNDAECSFTHTTRKSFGLTGDDEFVYYETLDKLPQRPKLAP